MRFDGGTEYGGSKLVKYAREHGILLEPTVPYTPEQDGVAERGFRTLFERVRTIAIDYDISKSLWPELVSGMVHVINRTATTSIKGDYTPLQALERHKLGDKVKKSSIAHIRALGCKAFVHIQKPRRVQSEKLADRAEIGILVGFEGEHIYRVYVPS